MRIDKIKYIREKLLKNEVTLGTWQQIPHASISEILGSSGYDWVAVDLEHGSIAINELPNLFRAIELGDTLPLVRVAESKPINCKQALDAGAGGVILPMIESSEQLERVIDFCSWPPKGKRGVGFSRANLFGKYFDKYIEEAQAPLIIAQIEHINAIKNLEKILNVKGLDAIMIGPYDLSASLKLTGEFESKEFISANNKIIKLCKKHNMSYGYHVVQPDNKLLSKRINQGYQFLAYSIDSVFLYNSSNIIKQKK